jgi:putative transposase
MKVLPQTNSAIGLDLGVNEFVVTSDGEVFENLKLNRSNQLKLKKLHKKLSKKQKKSKNRNKCRIKLAKFYEKLNNRKLNYLHQVSNKILDENQVIVIEDLNVKGMLKNHKLAKSIQEVSFSEFRRILDYKCVWYGRELVVIDRFYASSKLCNNCGYKNKGLTLKDREWICPDCGINHNRDLNASCNIRDEGLRIIGSRTAEFKSVENPTMDDPFMLKSSGSLKQKERFSNFY